MNLELIANDNFGKYQPSQVKIAGHINDVIMAIGKKYEPSFEIKTEFDKWLYNNLVYYFTDDSRCEWNLSKGLLFHGRKGLGKSLSFKIFKKLYYYKASYNIELAKKKFDIQEMDNLKGNVQTFYEKCKTSLFCDEIMRETKDDSKIINDYGTKEQPFSTGVHQMYRSFCDKGQLYHFTTNYWNVQGYENGKLISNTYGSEIHDRLIEMCNIIEFKGESKRR